MRAELPQYGADQLVTWIERFFRLWSRNQWKRERYAPSFHRGRREPGSQDLVPVSDLVGRVRARVGGVACRSQWMTAEAGAHRRRRHSSPSTENALSSLLVERGNEPFARSAGVARRVSSSPARPSPMQRSASSRKKPAWPPSARSSSECGMRRTAIRGAESSASRTWCRCGARKPSPGLQATPARRAGCRCAARGGSLSTTARCCSARWRGYTNGRRKPWSERRALPLQVLFGRAAGASGGRPRRAAGQAQLPPPRPGLGSGRPPRRAPRRRGPPQSPAFPLQSSAHPVFGLGDIAQYLAEVPRVRFNFEPCTYETSNGPPPLVGHPKPAGPPSVRG